MKKRKFSAMRNRPDLARRFDGMQPVAGGSFTMGSEQFYPEERPLREVRVDDFWIDAKPVTNRQFAEFVAATGYVTFAEIPPDPKDYPGFDPAYAAAGSLVFTPTDGPVDLNQPFQWWAFISGADWCHPTGPDSSIDSIMDHPVVHIVHQDAKAYADWAGKELPTEAQWEYAARGKNGTGEYAWGDELSPGGALLANYWHGPFPHGNTAEDGYERTSPVGAFPANDYGLYDMIGNVWEWTSDWFGMPQPTDKAHSPCCVPANPRGARKRDSFDPSLPDVKIARKVLKGGSHLCAVSYCQRYRPAARHPQALDSSTSHIGFRCILREAISGS